MSSTPSTTIPSTTNPFCVACNRQFRTLSGFHSHLRQRRNDERCLAMYRGYLASLESISEPETESEPDEQVPSTTSPMDVDCVLTGDETAMEYDGGSLALEEGYDEEPEGSANRDDGTEAWEPEREGAPAEFAAGDQDSDEELESGDEAAEHRRQAERILVDTGDGPKPHVAIRYTQKHPNSRAGSVLTQSNTHDDQYASTVNSDKNVWAPFKSRVDWEIAHWAKMRGPGSTALSELLAIEGVCFYASFFASDVDLV